MTLRSYKSISLAFTDGWLRCHPQLPSHGLHVISALVPP